MIEIDCNGRKMPVFVAAPEGAAGKNRAVIIVHEIFGLDDHIKDIATRFAKEGFIAFAPDLFANYPNEPADRTDLQAMRGLWSSIPDATLIADMQKVFALTQKDERVNPDEIGTIGYCMGGAIAFMFACSTPGVAWVGDYYGRILYQELTPEKPKHPLDYVETLSSPVLGLYAGHDELIKRDHVEKMQKRVEEKGVESEFKIYGDAKHAFFNDRRPFYDEAAATDAWKRTLEFVAKS